MTLEQTLVRRRTWCLAAWALVMTICAAWPGSHSGAAQRPGSGRDPNEASAGNGDQPMMRVREGAVLDATGYFKVSGDRALFTTADGTGRYTGLENLNLERVAIAVSESPDQLLWSVTGTVTEYRGTNYLLVTLRAAQEQALDLEELTRAHGPQNGGFQVVEEAGRSRIRLGKIT